MFHTHQPTIARFAQRDARALARVLRFVVLTIRQPLYRAVDQSRDLERLGPERVARGTLFGHKANAVAFIDANAEALYRDAMAIWSSGLFPEQKEGRLLAHFATIPGIGLVKAGFVLQLAFGLSGCLDSNNLARLHIAPRRVSSAPYKATRDPVRRQRRLRSYMSLVRRAGGTATLWNEWCAFVAGRDPGIYPNAHYVSKLHLVALGLTEEIAPNVPF